jgi:uncharacterized cupredoxin-like copper-binding protein
LHPRFLAALLPVAILVVACSDGAARPSSSNTPPSPAVPSPTTAAGSAVASSPAAASVTPSAIALAGDVPITMTDAMRFEPDPITVKAGVPITFIVRNAGLIVHEFVVGTEAEQADHAAQMATGHMAHGHHNALSVEPGDTSSLTMIFASAGPIVIGCHEAGHYDAGMRAMLSVVE